MFLLPKQVLPRCHSFFLFRNLWLQRLPLRILSYASKREETQPRSTKNLWRSSWAYKWAWKIPSNWKFRRSRMPVSRSCNVWRSVAKALWASSEWKLTSTAYWKTQRASGTQKINWQLLMKLDVQKLRMYLAGHVASIILQITTLGLWEP